MLLSSYRCTWHYHVTIIHPDLLYDLCEATLDLQLCFCEQGSSDYIVLPGGLRERVALVLEGGLPDAHLRRILKLPLLLSDVFRLFHGHHALLVDLLHAVNPGVHNSEENDEEEHGEVHDWEGTDDFSGAILVYLATAADEDLHSCVGPY